MQKYRQAALAIAFLSAMFTFGISANALAVARLAQPTNNSRIQETFETGDYESWKSLVGSRKSFQPIADKDKFSRFVAARQAARRGSYDEAIAVSQELEKEISRSLPVI